MGTLGRGSVQHWEERFYTSIHHHLLEVTFLALTYRLESATSSTRIAAAVNVPLPVVSAVVLLWCCRWCRCC